MTQSEDSANSKMTDLLMHMLEENYKDLCDKLKVSILDSLIELSDKARPETPGLLTKWDLILIKDGINELRSKEKEAELEAVASVIQHLVERGNKELGE